jgi:hypothetical protein
MSVKIAISSISEFLDLALLPIKSALGSPSVSPTAAGARKVTLMAPATDGVSRESSVCLGELNACRAAAIELMRDQRKLALEGFLIEEVAALCFQLNYRWRLESGPTNRSRFIIEPGAQTFPSNSASQKETKVSGDCA